MVVKKKTVLEIELERNEADEIECASGQEVERFVRDAIKKFLAEGVQTPRAPAAKQSRTPKRIPQN